jgi:hypothetical protein
MIYSPIPIIIGIIPNKDNIDITNSENYINLDDNTQHFQNFINDPYFANLISNSKLVFKKIPQVNNKEISK